MVKEQESIMKELVLSLLFGALVIAAAYYQRGYWAVGAEMALPVILLVVLMETEKKEKEK